jgi:5-hydroxyisourate hydrolase
MISTHILDISKGIPATGVKVKLQKKGVQAWEDVAKGLTNEDGRCSFECEPATGIFRILFEVESYLKKGGDEAFFMRIPVVFKVEDSSRKYHIPLLLSPFGYSTYRGS